MFIKVRKFHFTVFNVYIPIYVCVCVSVCCVHKHIYLDFGNFRVSILYWKLNYSTFAPKVLKSTFAENCWCCSTVYHYFHCSCDLMCGLVFLWKLPFSYAWVRRHRAHIMHTYWIHTHEWWTATTLSIGLMKCNAALISNQCQWTPPSSQIDMKFIDSVIGTKLW